MELYWPAWRVVEEVKNRFFVELDLDKNFRFIKLKIDFVKIYRRHVLQDKLFVLDRCIIWQRHVSTVHKLNKYLCTGKDRLKFC